MTKKMNGQKIRLSKFECLFCLIEIICIKSGFLLVFDGIHSSAIMNYEILSFIIIVSCDFGNVFRSRVILKVNG